MVNVDTGCVLMKHLLPLDKTLLIECARPVSRVSGINHESKWDQLHSLGRNSYIECQDMVESFTGMKLGTDSEMHLN
jgi:hypothetical protein